MKHVVVLHALDTINTITICLGLWQGTDINLPLAIAMVRCRGVLTLVWRLRTFTTIMIAYTMACAYRLTRGFRLELLVINTHIVGRRSILGLEVVTYLETWLRFTTTMVLNRGTGLDALI